MSEDSGHCWWLYWCRELKLDRWQEECRLVEDRFSLFQSFAEAPFFGFRGIVSRSGSVYNVTVAAEMDLYPKYVPWVFVTPTILGAREDGKLNEAYFSKAPAERRDCMRVSTRRPTSRGPFGRSAVRGS